MTLSIASGCLGSLTSADDDGDGADASPADAVLGSADAEPVDARLIDGSRADAAPPDAALPDAPPASSFCLGSDVIVRDELVGSSSGTVSGGTFTAEGWRTTSTDDHIYWQLSQVVSAGSIDFWARGFHANVGGCVWGVCYYVGLFEEANGDKLGDYTGSAFIESRYHNDEQENFHDTFKLQAGAGNGSMAEPMITPGIGWSASEWHHFRIEWGGGSSRLHIDDALELTAPYSTSSAIQWRHLFLGSTNYKGLGWAATDVTYRDLCVRTE